MNIVKCNQFTLVTCKTGPRWLWKRCNVASYNIAAQFNNVTWLARAGLKVRPHYCTVPTVRITLPTLKGIGLRLVATVVPVGLLGTVLGSIGKVVAFYHYGLFAAWSKYHNLSYNNNVSLTFQPILCSPKGFIYTF